jgi:hypothetical protein
MNNFIQSIEKSLETNNYYAALAVALSAPDICGWLLDPNFGSKNRYIAWFEKYLLEKYTREATERREEHIFLSGSDCYALRCAFLHEGRENITDQRAREVLESFQFVVPPNGWTVHKNQFNDTLQLQVDVFCRDVIDGITCFIEEIQSNPDAMARMNQSLIIRDVNGNPL